MDYKWFHLLRGKTACTYTEVGRGTAFTSCVLRMRSRLRGLRSPSYRNPKQYPGSDDSYDAQMAFWLIDIALLGRDTRMPISNADGTEAATTLVNQSKKAFMWIPKRLVAGYAP